MTTIITAVLVFSQDKLYRGSHYTVEFWNCLGEFNLTGKITHTYGSVHSQTVNAKLIITSTRNVFNIRITMQVL